METKRCAYCHKLQRVGSPVCSRCGRSFERYISRGGKSWGSSVSHFSLPAASPHHVGHYSGLHPEDQPYQSQIMVTPQRFMQEMREKQALQQEPKHIVLPSVQNAPSSNRQRGISQVPTHRPLSYRRYRGRLGSGNASPGSRETQGSFGREGRRGQGSRPFVREALPTRVGTSSAPTGFSVPPVRAGASPAPTRSSALPTRAGTSSAPTGFSVPPVRAGASPAPTRFSDPTGERIAATGGDGIFEPIEAQETQKAQGIYLPLEDASFSVTNDSLPSVEDLPVYMREALRVKQGPSRLMSTVLVSIGFCMLLATSISVLVLLGHRP